MMRMPQGFGFQGFRLWGLWGCSLGLGVILSADTGYCAANAESVSEGAMSRSDPGSFEAMGLSSVCESKHRAQGLHKCRCPKDAFTLLGVTTMLV